MAKTNVVKLYQKNRDPILVTQPYLPSVDKYMLHLGKAFDRQWVTNSGPLVGELTARLKDLLNVKYLLLVSNGTSALQLAYRIKSLGRQNVVTTPFTFPATLTALNWSDANIRLCDIDAKTWNLCPIAVEKEIKKGGVNAIVPVNIFGMPCNMSAFEVLGKKYRIPVIYDSAQAMLSKFRKRSILKFGDIHCISFHATKLFHTVEGGALTFKHLKDFELATKLINFGIEENGEVNHPGINAKMSEFHAAMGLCVLDDLPMLVENRLESMHIYHQKLKDIVQFQKADYDCFVPPMYIAVKFESEQQLLHAQCLLKQNNIIARRYFYPANHKFIKNEHMRDLKVNNEITDKILCLPLMHNLPKHQVNRITRIVSEATKLA